MADAALNRREMRLVLIATGCVCLGMLQACASHHVHSKRPSEKRTQEREARAAATAWLALVDTAEYAAAYASEPERLRKATTEEQFVRSMEGRRVPFGRVLARSFIGAAFTHKLTGSPDGQYQRILFRTSFANKPLAAERVILSHESGQWRVVDYRVY